MRRLKPTIESELVDGGDDELDDDYILSDSLEYLHDGNEDCDDDAPYHMILMPSTYYNPETQIEHVASSCVEVLNIPYDKAHELSMFAKYESFSVLGTWKRKDCISMGETLRGIGVECRIVPQDERLYYWKCPDFVPQMQSGLGDAATFEQDRSDSCLDVPSK
jgi:hypothetical protein